MVRENEAWGYDRIQGALANLGHIIAPNPVKNILKRHGIPDMAVPFGGYKQSGWGRETMTSCFRRP